VSALAPTKFDLALDAAFAEAEAREVALPGDRNLLALEAMRFLHMASDAGRPSDAARTIGRYYLRDPERFRAEAQS
jgi:hypothetical protein